MYFISTPPYKDTKTYNGKNGFPYEKFYDWVKELGKNNFVFILNIICLTNLNVYGAKEVKVLQKSDKTKEMWQ